MSILYTFGTPAREFYDWQVKNCGGFLVTVQENKFTFEVLREL
jgi:hypothetical protein